MKQRLIEIATFILFLLPLLLILVSPNFATQALSMNQPFTRSVAAPIQKSFYGMGGLYDGWVLESGEFTGVGGSMNTTSTMIALGDDVANRQYRGIITFNTGTLPNTASIQSAALYLTGNGVVGISPFVWGDLNADIRNGVFGGNKNLQLIDFQAAASFSSVGIRPSCAVTGKCSVALSGRAFPYINRLGLTQFRLRFVPDDNNNKKADYYKIFSGDVLTVKSKPVLVIKYYP
jgi:hypothetical protein